MASRDPTTDDITAIVPLLEVLTLADPAPTFTLFPKLPPELRNKIWKKACFVSRVVDVWCVPVGDTGFGDACVRPFRQKIWMFKSHSQPPILHASKEARSIDLQYYELSSKPRRLPRLDKLMSKFRFRLGFMSIGSTTSFAQCQLRTLKNLD